MKRQPVTTFPWLIMGSDGRPRGSVTLAGSFPHDVAVGDVVRFEDWPGRADYTLDVIEPQTFVTGNAVAVTLRLSLREFVPGVSPRNTT